MSIIQRPTKQGNATTYQGKVAAGYTKILAAEVDADLDLIYSAWNQGVDTVNIQDGSITGSKLAPGSVGTRELQDGGIQTVDIGDGQVTTPKLADASVTSGKLAPGAVTAGTIADGSITGAKIADGTITSADIADGTIQTADIADGAITSAKIADGTITGADIAAATIGTGNLADGSVTSAKIADSTIQTVDLADGVVTRAKLGVNANIGNFVTIGTPTGFILSAANVWTHYQTLPVLNTRGGAVILLANPCLSCSAPPAGASVASRWLRDGTVLIDTAQFVALASGNICTMPGVQWMDLVGAGAHTYEYQVFVQAGCGIWSGPFGNGGFIAIEIG